MAQPGAPGESGPEEDRSVPRAAGGRSLRSIAQTGSGRPSWSTGLTSTSPLPGPAGLFLADVPNRVVGFLIDAIVLLVIDLSAGLLVTALLGSGLLGLVLWLGAAALISLAYFAWSWRALRASPGMRLLGLRIGHEADGRPITPAQGLRRWALLGIPLVLTQAITVSSEGIATILALIGVVWLAVLLYSVGADPGKQGYHDRVARTSVVKARRRSA